MESKNLVLRTIYIDPDVDDQLRTEAFDKRTSKNDLLRKYLRIGMETAKNAGMVDAEHAGELVKARPSVFTDPFAAPAAAYAGAAGSASGAGNFSAAGTGSMSSHATVAGSAAASHGEPGGSAPGLHHKGSSATGI